jgi:hypothetical protein
VLLTRPPLPRSLSTTRSFDLHVLGTPPAFILSQDQTRHPWFYLPLSRTHAPGVFAKEGSCPRSLSCDPGQAVIRCTWLFADSCSRSLQNESLLFDRNWCARLRVHSVAVLLSTLQLSKYMNKRLFRSFASTQVLLHTSATVSRV